MPDKLHLLIVDSDPALRESCRDVAVRLGLATRLVDSAQAVRDTLSTADVHLILMDLRLPGGGLELLREVRTSRPDSLVLIASVSTSLQFAIEAMRYGAYDFLVKPFHYEELRLALERASDKWKRQYEGRRLRQRMTVERGYLDMVGDSPAMQKLFALIQRTAPSPSPVLITGEAGSGKEVAARALHRAGPRTLQPFHLLDCRAAGAITLDTMSEAVRAAQGGTLFFDEVSELPLSLQSALVRAIHTQQLEEMPVRARIVAATQRDLDQLSLTGQFRRDLFFALNAVKLQVPPLRERREDIPLLARHFLERARQTRSEQLELPEELMRRLTRYEWRGNVRELEACIERACASSVGAVISQNDLLTKIASQLEPEECHNPDADSFGITPLAVLEKRAILHALERLGGDRLEAANRLGIGKTTLYRKIKEYQLEGERVL